jgi:hypothetical protein
MKIKQVHDLKINHEKQMKIKQAHEVKINHERENKINRDLEVKINHENNNQKIQMSRQIKPRKKNEKMQLDPNLKKIIYLKINQKPCCSIKKH